VNAGDTSLPSSTDPSPQALLQALGSRLRQSRELSEISLADLARQLRMGEEQLLALENGDRAGLPEMVFVIAQARRVADALACDITDLLAPLKQETGVIKPIPAPLEGTQQGLGRLKAQSYAPASARSSRHSKRPWFISVGVLATLLIAASWGWQQHNHHQLSLAAKAAKPKAAPRPILSQPATQLTLQAAQPSWIEVRNAAGKQLFQGTLQGRRTFPLKGGLQLLASRPERVQVSLGNKPAQPLGRIDQIPWVSFRAPTR